MICPNCGESNSPGFRFCGMCGTVLEPRRPAGAPRVANSAEAVRVPTGQGTEPTRATNALGQPQGSTVAVQSSPRVPVQAGIAGPSLLGLDQATMTREAAPSIDTLRDKSFSGLDSFFEPEEPSHGGRRVVLLILLLAALGAAGWWTYNNYLGAITGSATQKTATTPTANTSDTSANSVARPGTPTSAAPSSQPADASQPQATTPPPAQSQTSNPPAPVQHSSGQNTAPQKTPPSSAQAKPPVSGAKPSTNIASTKIASAKPTPAAVPAARPEPRDEPAADDNGDAAYRQAEGYLYGRGVAENCDEAIKYLKAAAAKQNAKARSMFGTMYATGHCVPRDLPTSYSWFALALRVDPNNQILEKDLTAIWNQMTPPERQIATRSKQQ
jgi:zinc-ribbon domain